MGRTISEASLRALFAQETDAAFLVLLTIDHDDLAEPVRVVNNKANITSRGNTYVGLPFLVDLPGSEENKTPEVTLTLDNIEQTIIETLRSIDEGPTIDIEVINADEPDTVLVGPFPMTLLGIDYDRLTISGTLGYEKFMREKFPPHSFNPSTTPGIF